MAKRTWRKRRDARPLADLIGDLVAPSARARGFATADLVLLWPDLVGPAFAAATRPEKIAWPRVLGDGGEDEFRPATLTVRCSGARALLFQHEAGRVIERINAAFGYEAVDRIRIVQRPVTEHAREIRRARDLTRDEAMEIGARVAPVADPELRASLEKLGRAIKSNG